MIYSKKDKKHPVKFTDLKPGELYWYTTDSSVTRCQFKYLGNGIADVTKVHKIFFMAMKTPKLELIDMKVDWGVSDSDTFDPGEWIPIAKRKDGKVIKLPYIDLDEAIAQHRK